MKKLLKPFLVFCCTLCLHAQDSLLENSTKSEAEFHAAINPNNPDHIVLATLTFDQLDNSEELEVDIKIYFTIDGGTTWSVSDFDGAYNSETFVSDPVVSFDQEGTVYLTNLVFNETGESLDTVLSKSTDFGNTWTLVATVATGDTDKPWIAIDGSDSSNFIGNIYIPLVEGTETDPAFNLYTFNENGEEVNKASIPNGGNIPTVVTKNNGDIFVSTMELGFGDTPDIPAVVYIQQYDQEGKNLVHSTEIVRFADYSSIVPDVSERFFHQPSLAIDNSGGTYDGRLYLTYTVSESTANPAFFDIYITYSDDNGITWSAPKSIHTTPARTQQFFSSIYVNSNGVLLIDWFDRRNFDSDSKLTDFYIATSTDGSETFVENKINSQSTDFNSFATVADGFGVGDYHQVVASEDEGFSFWSDGRTNDGNLNIYMAKVDVTNPLNVIEYSVISSDISISPLYPQPSTGISSVLVNTTKNMNLYYEIFSYTGQHLYRSENKSFSSGQDLLDIDTKNLPSGNYLLKISNDTGFFKTIPFIRI